jgi:hypothetical protein
MVQLVFVHGVATRSSPAYDTEEANRNKLFTFSLFSGAPLKISSPRWGDLVPNLSYGGAVFPENQQDAASLSLVGGLSDEPAVDASLSAILPKVAEADAAAAVDALFAALVAQADEEGRLLTDEEVEQFRAAADLLDDESFSLSLPADASDDDFIDALRERSSDDTAYGIGDSLKGAATGLIDRARNLVGTGLTKLFRDDLNPAVARFIGDVFVYLKPGAPRDSIRARVRDALVSARAAATAANEPLVLIGHSLGGVILYDMLSSPVLAGLPADFKVDALVTVGSQPGLFQEMGLFDFVSPATPPAKVPGPSNVAHWISIYDPIDIFGFRADPVFGAAKDYAFNSVTGLVSAHTTYFRRPQFHARLRKRLQAAGVI